MLQDTRLFVLQADHGRMMTEKGFRDSPPADVVKKRGVVGESTRREIGSELADVFLRLIDLADTLKINLEGCVTNKMSFNATRPNSYGTPSEVKGV